MGRKGGGYLKRAPTEAGDIAEPTGPPRPRPGDSETGSGWRVCPPLAPLGGPGFRIKINLGESDGREERKKHTGGLYVCFLPADSLSPELWRLKLQGVTSPLLGWSFVVSITWSITSHTPAWFPRETGSVRGQLFCFCVELSIDASQLWLPTALTPGDSWSQEAAGSWSEPGSARHRGAEEVGCRRPEEFRPAHSDSGASALHLSCLVWRVALERTSQVTWFIPLVLDVEVEDETFSCGLWNIPRPLAQKLPWPPTDSFLLQSSSPRLFGEGAVTLL